MILASRPPITLPTLSVPPSLLDELISELGALSAVYHKYDTDSHPVSRIALMRLRSRRPVQAFIAGGKLGADQISTTQRSEAATREAALATVVAGQKAENVRRISLPDLVSPHANALLPVARL